MNKRFQIVCENNGAELFIEQGCTLAEVLDMLSLHNEHPFLAAYVDNKLRELEYELFSSKSVRFIDITHFEGIKVYQRSLSFILQKAVHDILPDCQLHIEHSGSRGLYCEIEGLQTLSAEILDRIKARMRNIIDHKLPFVRQKIRMAEAEAVYEKFGLYDKVSLLRTRPQYYSTLFFLADFPGYFYGALVPSTDYIHLFDLTLYHEGFYIVIPKRLEPNELNMIKVSKMFDIYHEFKDWVEILGVANIGDLNAKIMAGEAADLVKIAEVLHEKKLSQITDTIVEKHRQGGAKIVMISGPSSSGKTSFGKRLGIHIRVHGLTPVMLSLDNYFVERSQTPLDSDGRPDYEALEALDVEGFNTDLLRLLAGETVEIPKFDFIDGKRFYDGTTLCLSDDSILIIEGIHALNPRLTPHIDAALKFGIFVSALTSISMDKTSVIHTVDNRIIRRIVRDSQYRNRSAYDTLSHWHSIRRGEENNVFPYQDLADVMFNSALFFEFSVLKRYAEPLLDAVPANTPEYGEAMRLKKLLDYFVQIPDKNIPPTSIIREFIGGSSFEY